MEDLPGTTKGDFEGNIWTTNQQHFQDVGLGMCLIVFCTFIKVDPFESLTHNDATVCAKLFGPVTDFCYGVKVCVLKDIAKIQKLADAGWPPRCLYTSFYFCMLA